MKEAIIYLLAISLAETVTVFTRPVLGVVCHIMILVAVLLRPATGLAPKHQYQQLVLSLALVPLVRIISLSMPLLNIPQVWWYPLIYIPLLVATIVVVRILSLKANDVGLNFRLLPIQLVVALSGFLFGIVEYFILSPEPMVIELTWQNVWLPAFLLLACTGFVEEFIFRGVLQRTALGVFGRWGIIYVSLIFAVLHIGFLSWIDVIFVFAVALFFGWVVSKTGSLFGVILAHGITNIMLFLIAPLIF